MDFLVKMGRNIGDLVRRMSWMQRVSVIGLIVVLIAAISILISYSVGDNWVPLFDQTSMTSEDAKEAMKRLEESGVRYRDDGGRIYVPKEQRYKVASSKFLFDSTFSQKAKEEIYKWLWEPNFSDTPTRVKMQFDLSRSLDLAGCIRAIPEIEDATVNIVEEKKRFAFENQEPSSASVNVKLRPGIERLSKDIVEGIARLLEGSVRNLKAQDVNVIAGGRYYKVPREDEDIELGNDLLEQKLQREKQLAKNCREALGIPTSTVIVTIPLKQSRVTRQHEEGPDDARSVLENMIVSKEESLGGSGGGGKVGAPPNVTSQTTGSSGNGSYYKKEEREAIYDPYRTAKTTEPVPGIAGLMDKENITATVSVPLPEVPFKMDIISFDYGCGTHLLQLDGWRNEAKTIVANTCNISEGKVAINVIPTKRIIKEEVKLTNWQKFTIWWTENWTKAMLGIVALIAVGFVAYSVTKTAPREVRTEEVATVAMLEGAEEEEEEEEPEEEEDDDIIKKIRREQPEVTLDEPEMSVREQKVALMQEKIQEAVTEDPRKASALVRSWLRQEL
ncbi:MAG: hypothetical protein ACYS8W_04750 [Planctomycetota bacterium]|jgi:flagellar M-ring protein FliF